MTGENLLSKLGAKGADIQGIVNGLVKKSRQIPDLVEALQAEKSSKKYAYEKALRLLSEKNPEWIYPYFDVFVSMLDNDNSFLKWGAIMTVANLTAVDTEGKFEQIFNKYFRPIRDSVMVTAANIIGSSVKVVQFKPELADRIANEILKVEKANYLNKGTPSPECRNIAIGQAIDAFDRIYEMVEPKARIVSFIKRQKTNTRKAVAKKAEDFIRKNKTT